MTLQAQRLSSPGLRTHLRTKPQSRQRSETTSPEEAGAEGISYPTSPAAGNTLRKAMLWVSNLSVTVGVQLLGRHQQLFCRTDATGSLRPTEMAVTTTDDALHFTGLFQIQQHFIYRLYALGALYKDSAVLNTVCFIGVAGEQLSSSLKTTWLL